MTEDVYERLAGHLDDLPAGFPRTESGVEMRLLRRLFTPADAKLAVHLTLIPEEPRVIAHRAGMAVEVVAQLLDGMEKKGLIMGIPREGKPPQYRAEQFVVGFWEAQVNRLSPDLFQDVEEYLPAFFNLQHWRKAPQMRTIPVNKSISVQNEIMAYETAEELIRSQDSLAVSNCICRQGMRLLGRGCDKPEESCFTLGMAADYITHSGRGRRISRDEGIAIFQRADEAGLVLQPANAREPLFMCTCCGCCCGVLRSIQRDPKPASVVSSPFFAALNTESCNGCGRCTKRCQMAALSLSDKKAFLDPDRCIGCGLCVSKCPTQSLSLVRKPKSEQADVPKDIVRASIKVAQARGKLGIAELVAMQVRSKLDRLLALK